MQHVARQIFRIGTVQYAEGLWCMCRHGLVIAHCTDSEDFPVASDVTIIEPKIEIEFFFENRIESKSIFWLVFFQFWLTAILAKTTHCCEFKAWQSSRGKECWIRRLNYTNCMPQRPRGAVATATSRCRVATSYPTYPCIIDPSLLSPSYVLCGRATACTWYLHHRVL